MRKLIKKGDLAIICIACFIAAAMMLIRFIPSDKNKIAVVVQNGRVTDEIDLSMIAEGYELTISGGKLLVEKDQISYIEADCPDHICIRSGILKNAGDTAACVPNKTCVYIKGRNKIDAITY